jgi:DNA-binding transcriptional ArsR family regulator
VAEDIAHGIPLDPDDVFSALSNSRRRQVILSVSRTGSAVSAGDLAVEIAAQENVVDPAAVTSEQRTRVYVSLIQGHLEKLDEAGAIDYQPRSKEAAPTAATDPLADHIRQITTACYAPAGDTDGE